MNVVLLDFYVQEQSYWSLFRVGTKENTDRSA